jgi:hypothetical protein
MKRILLLFVISAVLAGCLVMVPGHLYPIQGSLAAQSPVPVYKVTLSGVLNSGTMAATLENGEVCNGKWTPVRQNDLSARKFADEWDRVYGEGFFVANILGSPVVARAILAGTKGTTLTAEFYVPTPGDIIGVKGIAMDGNGNLFKLTF